MRLPMSPIKIVVTGANGQLGRELQMIAADYPLFEFIFLSKDDLPIEHLGEVQDFFKKTEPTHCINCAAYTAVDKAESEKEKAFLINGESVGVLASICKSTETKFIHISTDYVFDGNSSKPLKEVDATMPLNVYGASKLNGEILATQNNSDSIIIRTAWLYSAFGNNFVRTMIRLMGEKKSINVVSDQIGSPTYAGDLANTIMQIISSGKFVSGIYHYSNEGETSWYEFAIAIKEMIGSNCEVNPIPASQYPTPAKRPQYSLLDKTKIKTIYDVEIPEWKSSLRKCINQLVRKEV
jgi:dTDP-4-dehydrorhamnose reductase